jgi:hypothetical protein
MAEDPVIASSQAVAAAASHETQQLMREALGQPASAPSTVEFNWAAAEHEVREVAADQAVNQLGGSHDELADYPRSRNPW